MQSFRQQSTKPLMGQLTARAIAANAKRGSTKQDGSAILLNNPRQSGECKIINQVQANQRNLTVPALAK